MYTFADVYVRHTGLYKQLLRTSLVVPDPWGGAVGSSGWWKTGTLCESRVSRGFFFQLSGDVIHEGEGNEGLVLHLVGGGVRLRPGSSADERSWISIRRKGSMHMTFLCACAPWPGHQS